NTSRDMPSACHRDRPAALARVPKMMPKGIAPRIKGRVSRAPLRNSWKRDMVSPWGEETYTSQRCSSHSASGPRRADDSQNPSLGRQRLLCQAARQCVFACAPTGKADLQLPLDLRPFQVGDAVQHGIVETAVGQATMIAQQTLTPSTELFNRPLGAQVAGGGFQLHA